jgi:hypothetical protein
MSALTEIANRCGTDKGAIHGTGHAYTLVYEQLFHALRERPVNLLEIGLSAGGPEVPGGTAERAVTDAPSIRMWREYFPKAHIYGLDISDFKRFETDWFTFFRADCGNERELRRVADSGVEFDIIIDDGSHASYHQQLALKVLFPMLKPGGIYAIEDLNWQPRRYEAELPPTPKTTDYLRNGYDHPVVFYDEDQLMTMRRAFNRKAGLSPMKPHYIDRFSTHGYVRGIQEAVVRGLRAVAGISSRPERVKLAIIQKL